MVSSQDWLQSCTALSATDSSIMFDDTVGKTQSGLVPKHTVIYKHAEWAKNQILVMYIHGCFSTASRTFSITSSRSEELTDSITSTRYLLASL